MNYLKYIPEFYIYFPCYIIESNNKIELYNLFNNSIIHKYELIFHDNKAIYKIDENGLKYEYEYDENENIKTMKTKEYNYKFEYDNNKNLNLIEVKYKMYDSLNRNYLITAKDNKMRISEMLENSNVIIQYDIKFDDNYDVIEFIESAEDEHVKYIIDQNKTYKKFDLNNY